MDSYDATNSIINMTTTQQQAIPLTLAVIKVPKPMQAKSDIIQVHHNTTQHCKKLRGPLLTSIALLSNTVEQQVAASAAVIIAKMV